MLTGSGLIAGTLAWQNRPAEANLLGTLGRHLAPDTSTNSLGDVAPDATATVAFTLRNLTGHPIRIQGAQTSCSCTVVEGIPCVISPGDTRGIKGVVHANKEPGQFAGSFVLYTDDDGEPEVRLEYTGRVVEPIR